jgi:hypothetical protein
VPVQIAALVHQCFVAMSRVEFVLFLNDHDGLRPIDYGIML